MSWLSDMQWLRGGGLVVLGGAIGFFYRQWRDCLQRKAVQASKQEILDATRREAEGLLREARLAANEQAQKAREQMEAAFAERRRGLDEREQRLVQREQLINQQLEVLLERERALREQQADLECAKASLEARRAEADALLCQRREQLLKLANLPEAEARSLLFQQLEQEALRDAGDVLRGVVEQAKSRAEAEARRILGLAIQRYAGEHTFETTTATVALSGDELKGRIIGREGRNIRAFEAATGVTVLIDDTPNAVVLSSFDPVRREIARQAMERLVQDGRIHPGRIEEVVAKVSQEMDQTIVRAGEEAVLKVGLPPLPADLVVALGRLRFRHSFAQNILDHSVEVAHLAGLIAAELGVDVTAAKRAGLLHDIGKGINHAVEGPHALVGAEMAKRHGESPEVVNGVAAHHDEAPHTSLVSVLVSAADAISASRPGARSESMEAYLKRLENLEKIGLSFPGVEKCYAIQAGRELRVIVQPEKVTDQQAQMLARNIARRVEEQVQHSGLVRVTVIRETRCVEFAK